MNIEEFIRIIDKYAELSAKYNLLMKKKSHSKVEKDEINTTTSLIDEVCMSYFEKLGNLSYTDLKELKDALLLKLREINLKIPRLEAEIQSLEDAANDALQKNDFNEYLNFNGLAFKKEADLEALNTSKDAYNLFTENILSLIKIKKPQISGY